MISAYKTAETDPIPCKRVCLKLEFRHSRKYSHIEGAQHKEKCSWALLYQTNDSK